MVLGALAVVLNELMVLSILGSPYGLPGAEHVYFEAAKSNPDSRRSAE